MKTILVLSDTHGNLSDMEKLKGIMAESDYVFHLGDYRSDMLAFREFSSKIYSVCGNCDGGGNDEIVEIEGLKIMLTHGDRYSVKNGLYKLILKAKEICADVVFFGHTHNACVEKEDGVYLINPGSMTRYGERSYCYAVVYDKKITAKIVQF